ncbi:gamma-glutamyltransferase [Cryptococcus wingfieldii CBS 7118]|uniref:Gamma-glutamyltransferase n=1 Tax=Cryptococcus wingfieldii CBS 7118 TaxID=1295528 RepID=A0A1E3J3W6_9TREE|nr:gamma-glutamyltransferase [Cryptococcus wingfieldii CBS 7118]ODN95355.1 gamma-glutamyltransferase [Cryptococcus wingfieldii CBS 7118]
MAPLDHARLHPAHQPQFAHFPSRRSTVFSTKGIVATSQVLAAQAGLEILNKGGNAADAAVATAAALNVTEPTCTGIGGDIFCLFYHGKTKQVKAVNGSGRAPKELTLEHLREQGITGDSIPLTNLNSVTVPGAAAGWLTTIQEFGSGKLSMRDILDPAIRMAREGVPEGELNAKQWQIAEGLLKGASDNWDEMTMPDGHAPRPSDVMTHATLADTFEAVAEHGHAGFYKGRIAQAIVDLVQSGGGVMSLDDLAECQAELVQPISYTYKPHHPPAPSSSSEKDPGVTLWECPPNGQGLTALVALGIVEAVEEVHGIDVLELEHNGVQYLHILIEALRLAFADSRYYVTDPAFNPTPVDELLSKPYLLSRAKLIDLTKVVPVKHGSPVNSSDTVYLATADNEGNSCSFIASNYAGFGTGAIPKSCGFTLQNRGTGFTLIPGHPNCVAGGKRPYHTIIPGMVTQGDDLLMSFGVMGGFMQPQGHIQVLLNKLRGFGTQASLDAPRFCISAGLPDNGTSGAEQGAGDIDSEIWFEEGISLEVIDELKRMGHQCEIASGYARKIAGKGQVVQRVVDPNGRRVWAAGSDLRGDGCAVGQI